MTTREFAIVITPYLMFDFAKRIFPDINVFKTLTVSEFTLPPFTVFSVQFFKLLDNHTTNCDAVIVAVVIKLFFNFTVSSNPLPTVSVDIVTMANLVLMGRIGIAA